MSILIKGIDIPQNCLTCKVKHIKKTSVVCNILNEACSIKGRLPSCPIIPIPEKHGRLIDADKLRNNEYFDVSPQERDLEDSVVYEIIDNAPTIIEAEK